MLNYLSRNYFHLRNIDTVFSVFLKGFALLSIINFCVGYYVFGLYLNQSGVKAKFTYLLVTEVLLGITTYSISASIFIILIMFFLPKIFMVCENEPEWQNDKVDEYKKFFIHTLIVFVLMFTVLIWALLIHSNNELFYLFVIIEIAIATCSIYKLYGGPKNKKNRIKAFNFLIVFLLILLTTSILGYIIIFLLSVSIKLNDQSYYSLPIILCLGYSVIVGLVNMKKFKAISYISILLFSFIIIYSLFSQNLTKKVIKTIGIGRFKSSVIIDSKNATILDSSKFTIKPTSNKDSVYVENVWVIASLSDKIIISDSENSKFVYILPASSKLGEKVITQNLNEKITIKKDAKKR